MKKKILTVTSALMISTSANAGGVDNSNTSTNVQPFDNIYLSATTGYSKFHKLKGGYEGHKSAHSAIMELGVKTDINEKLKVGASFGYRPSYNAKVTDSGVTTQSRFKVATLMLNASYDIATFNDFITPYAELSAGVSRINSLPTRVHTALGNSGISKNQISYNPAFGAGLGAKFKLSNNSSVLAGYRMSYLGKIKKDNVPVTNIGNQVIRGSRVKSNDFLVSFEYKL